MKISISNFKAIKQLKDFELKPFNAISGINSSGKSSLLQFLLLLKQTLSANNVNKPLIIDGDEISYNSFKELIYNLDNNNKCSFQITLEDTTLIKNEINYLPIEKAQLFVEFEFGSEEISVNKFEVRYFTPSESVKKEHHLIFSAKGDGTYLAETNTGVYNSDFFTLLNKLGPDGLTGSIIFQNFLPQVFTTELPSGLLSDLITTENKLTSKVGLEIKLKSLHDSLNIFFESISYLGPIRELPRQYYLSNSLNRKIGVRGEYTAYFLEKEAKQPTKYHKIDFDNDGLVTYEAVEETLDAAVNFWICEIFGLAKKIWSQEYKDSYSITVENQFGIQTSLMHVGFGVSQVLPVVVEGLRLKPGTILVIEQPEIHLHPKVQSLLFDFLYSLTLSGKKIFIETHSDHLIIRLRRRIAEDLENNIANNCNLIFVEENEGRSDFKPMPLTELGSFEYFPKDFIEQPESDYRAIVKAQAKRMRNANQS